MKRINYLLNGLAALALIVLFAQCAGKSENQSANNSSSQAAGLSGMKIAFVEVDTLLAKYNFCIDWQIQALLHTISDRNGCV